MKVKDLRSRLVRLPASIEFTLFLIQEDLKSNRLFSGLRKAGLDSSYYRPDFSAVVLESAGFAERPDDLFDFYFDLLDKSSEKAEESYEKIGKLAFNIYVDLVIEKRKRAKKQFEN
ncbi:MAG TPA: hypothetical protein VKQ08_02950 [Cyclobacteriaceae bacterium]|nr:hypothetical protein [Cyclobacteriaceae bacterium]